MRCRILKHPVGSIGGQISARLPSQIFFIDNLVNMNYKKSMKLKCILWILLVRRLLRLPSCVSLSNITQFLIFDIIEFHSMINFLFIGNLIDSKIWNRLNIKFRLIEMKVTHLSIVKHPSSLLHYLSLSIIYGKVSFITTCLQPTSYPEHWIQLPSR